MTYHAELQTTSVLAFEDWLNRRELTSEKGPPLYNDKRALHVDLHDIKNIRVRLRAGCFVITTKAPTMDVAEAKGGVKCAMDDIIS